MTDYAFYNRFITAQVSNPPANRPPETELTISKKRSMDFDRNICGMRGSDSAETLVMVIWY